MTADVAAGADPRSLPGVWLLELPFTTPLSLNDRMHHMVAAKRRAEWRGETENAAREAGIPHMRRCRVTMFYIPRYRRRHDPDNLVASMKPIADGLVDAMVVEDDTADFMERVWPVFLPADSKREDERGRILVQVERLV